VARSSFGAPHRGLQGLSDSKPELVAITLNLLDSLAITAIGAIPNAHRHKWLFVCQNQPMVSGSFDPTMREALSLATDAASKGDIPVGALVLDQSGQIIGRGQNTREQEGDPLGHAEIVALRDAATHLGNWRLDNCTLVVTLEPCTMCAGAIVQSRIAHLVFGAFDDKAGAVGSLWDVVRDRRLPHRAQVTSGVLADDCSHVLSEFFQAQRG